jgi:UDP:flavonoid glycosyltransferase YjiC (YdhE family)
MAHVPHRQLLRSVPFDDPGDGSSRASVATWLAGPPDADPLVYMTLGTVDRDRSPLRQALGAIARQRVRVLATVGPSGDPATLGPQPGHVRVEHYVPQSLVLPLCAAVISHAGSGTFLATLAAAVPQLCLPQAADQFINADACQQSGAGLALSPDAANPASIDAALSRLLAEGSFRADAQKLAAEIATMPGPDEVALVLENLSSPS